MSIYLRKIRILKRLNVCKLGFLCRFGLKTGIHFAYFGLESSMVFDGIKGVYGRIYRFNYK